MPLQSEGIKFQYGAKVILDDITAHFEQGHLYGILGPNGSGKTTFLKILAGLLRANYGRVMVDNLDLKNLTTAQIAKKVAVVPDSTSLIFDFSVEEIVSMGRYVYVGKFAQETVEDQQIVESALEQFNLVDLKDRSFNQLSAGERQKVIIARAIAQQSKIILLDEPTSHLDINYQVEFMEMLKKYVAEGLVVVTILHDLNLAAQYCDQILLVYQGKIQDFGTPEEILTRENIKLVYRVDVAVRKNAFTNSIYITHFSPKSTRFADSETFSNIKRIHVVAGGGTALELLPALQGNNVSIGVVNVLDDDYEIATELNYEIISEAPFSPISRKSRDELMQKLDQTDIVILTNLPFGMGNIENLEVVEACEKPLLILEKTPIGERDFSHGKATEIYDRVVAKGNAKKVASIQEILQFIQNAGGG